MKRKLERTRQVLRGGASGLMGDALSPELRYPERMQLRYHGQDCTPGEIARLHAKQAGGKDVVFFVHGLLYDDSCWRAATFDMTSAFENDLGMFAVHLLYDTGRHISDNGHELARLLQELADGLGDAPGNWHLVAHSMGGLVCRSSLFQAEADGMGFTRRIDRVVLLGTPNRGVPLEKGAQLVRLLLAGAPIPLRLSALGLRRLFHSLRFGGRAPLAPIAGLTDLWVYTVPAFFLTLAGRILDMRSDGIRDLRHGTMLREEWEKKASWGGLKSPRVSVPHSPGHGPTPSRAPCPPARGPTPPSGSRTGWCPPPAPLTAARATSCASSRTAASPCCPGSTTSSCRSAGRSTRRSAGGLPRALPIMSDPAPPRRRTRAPSRARCGRGAGCPPWRRIGYHRGDTSPLRRSCVIAGSTALGAARVDGRCGDARPAPRRSAN